MMETNEKAARLQVMLQEALQPMIDKIDSLEQEVKMLQEGQEKLQKLLSEKE
ncbi:hypothetical protein ACQKMN_13900 [Ureibacillus composti]